jgi:16S rRNA (cytosine967-C5)-methyltransferase
MTESRISAIACLTDILKKKGKPKHTLDQFAQSLDRRDRAFVMELVYGVLRHLFVLDWVIGSLVKDVTPLRDRTINNLRSALYQLLFMRVPVFAVVNEAVEIEKGRGKPSLVNAVLRNFLRRREALQFPIHFDDPVKEISVNTSHPEWMVKRWIAAYGIEEARAIAEANNRVPPLVIRANTLRISREDLVTLCREKGIPAEATKFSPEGITIDAQISYQDLTGLSGLFVVQDEASQLISHLLAPAREEKVLDACAAPGGKTTHIAQLMGDRGEIVAVEKDPLRTERIRDNVHALGIRSVQILRADIAELTAEGVFDRVLLDAPCSSTGVIRRNPDVKYRHRERDIAAFGRKQLSLLSTAGRLLKKGGRLVYSVCSPDPLEGDNVVQDFLKTSEEFRMIEPDREFVTPFMHNGFFRTFPHTHAMDGFFGVILCKKR